MKGNSLIEFRKLGKTYGDGETAVHALRDVDLSIDEGEFLAVMGPSGSGKSTCMNILGCLDSPTSGSYSFAGLEVARLTRDQRALLRRRFLGFVFQGFNLLQRNSAVENVELPLIYQRIGSVQRRKMALEALERVGLQGRSEHRPSELSGGQQQRVAIARALVTRPEVLLADEPTGNLDSATSMEVMELLVALNSDMGITVVMVTHEEDMARYAQCIVRFRDGRKESSESVRSRQ